jgi:hypothetical protein
MKPPWLSCEGTDAFMIKPGMPFPNVLYRVKQTLGVQTFVYQTSVGYAMHKATFASGWLNKEIVILESLRCFKRRCRWHRELACKAGRTGSQDAMTVIKWS